MADGKTDINVQGQVDLKDKVSQAAEKIANGLDKIADSAKFAAYDLSLLEARLNEINELEKASKMTASQARSAREKMYSSVESETKAHEENAKAINNEAKALDKFAASEKKRADAYKDSVDFKTSKEGLAEAQRKRDAAKYAEQQKNYRQDKKAEVKMAETAERTANRKLREQTRKDRIRNSRRGANSVFGNLLNSAEDKIRDRGIAGRATGAVLGTIAAGLTRGPAGAIAQIARETGSALMDFRDSVLEAYGSVEKIKTQMGVVFGSKVQANAVFNDIADYAVKSPFGIESVSEFAVLLKQSGVYSSDLLDTLKMIGDTAGGDNEKMKRIANNYAQIVAVGKASMLDMRQFAYAGIPIYKEVADYLKVSQSELRKMISDGEVSAEVIEKVFEKMTSKGGVFNEATEKGALTLSSRRQNLEDVKTMTKAQLGELQVGFFNKNGTGGLERNLIDLEESFYNGLKNWGEKTNIARNVERLATAKSEIKEWESRRKAIESDTNVSDETKKTVLRYIDKQIATLKTFSNNENAVSILSLAQKAFEEQSRNYQEAQEIQSQIDILRSRDLPTALNNYEYMDEKTGKERTVRRELPTALSNDIFGGNLSEIKRALNILNKNSNSDDKYLTNLQNILVKLTGLLERQEELASENGKFFLQTGVPKPNVESTYESQLAAGIEAVTKLTSFYEDKISEVQKSQTGIVTRMGLYNQILNDTPEAKQKKIDKQLKEIADIKNEAIDYKKNVIGPLESGRISLKDLSLDRVFRLETDFADISTGYYGKSATDFLTGLEEDADFKSEQTKKDFIDAIKDTLPVLDFMKSNTNDKEILDKISQFRNDIKYGKWDSPATVKNFFTDFRALSDAIDDKLKQNLTPEEKEYYTQLKTVLASILRRNSYTTGGAENIDLEAARGILSGINSIDLEPQWKRAIANATGLDINLMKNMGAKDILEKQLAPTLSRQLVSSAIASIYKNGGASGTGKNDLNYAYRLLSFDGFKALGSGDEGGNLATVKTIASEKTKSSSSKPTAVNYQGPVEKVAQINWMQTEKNILNAAKSGKLNSGTMQLLQQTMDSRTDVLTKLIQASFETSENGEYVKGQDFNNAFVNAFSGLQIGEDETVKAVVNGKEETLTFDRTAKQFKTSSGELLKATDDVEYSLEYLSRFIQKYGKQISEASDELKTAIIKQGTYEESRAGRRSSLIETQASISAMEYLNAHPELNVNGMYEYLVAVIIKRLNDKIKDETEIGSLDDVKSLIPDDVLKYSTSSGTGNIAEFNAETLKKQQENSRKSTFNNEYAKLYLSGGTFGNENSVRVGIRKAFGLTGTNSYADLMAMNSLGLSGNWKDISSAFGENRLTNLKDTSPENMNLLQKREMQALRDNFGEEGQSDKDLLSSISGDTSKLEQASSILRDMDASFLDMTKLVEELGNGGKDIAKQFASSAITDTTKQIGENLIAGNDAMEGCGKRMKELGTAAMSNLSSLFVQAGLSIIATKPHMWAAGAALIAAGGMAGIISGMMSGTDDDSDEDEAAKLKSIKEDLSDLLEQARNDAIYYENELRHRNALSTGERLSGSTRTSSVHDALISSNGNIITTDPKDYLIATKHPEELAGGAGSYSPKISFNVVNKSSGQVSSSYNMSKDSDGNINIEAMIEDKIVEMISSSKTDDAFMAREARKNGRSVVA